MPSAGREALQLAMQTVDFEHPSFRSDPFPTWSDLQSRGSLHRDSSGAWVVVSYREVDRLLRDSRVGKDLRQLSDYADEHPYGVDSAAERYIEQWIGCRLPAVHRKWRRLIIPGFTHKGVEGLGHQVRRLADDLLAKLPADGSFEFMERFARPFPVAVIAHALELTHLDHDRLKHWTLTIGDVLEPGASAQARRVGDVALEELVGCLWDQVAARRRAPRGGLLSHLVAVSDGVLTDDELVATLLLLFLSGNDTTASLIANGLLALLRNPDQAALLRANPDLMPAAVEEILRYDGPACIVVRATYEPVTVEDTTIPAGTLLLLALGAANRDPAAFREPDRFLIDRRPNRHFGFGDGDHYCVGTGLARLEAVTALRGLFSRFPHLGHDESSLRWGNARYLRGPEHMQVSTNARSGTRAG